MRDNIKAITTDESSFLAGDPSLEGCMIKLGENIIEARSVRQFTIDTRTYLWTNAATTSSHILQGNNAWLVVHDTAYPNELFAGNILSGRHKLRAIDTAKNQFGTIIAHTTYRTLFYSIECRGKGMEDVEAYIQKKDPNLRMAQILLACTDRSTASLGQLVVKKFGTNMAVETMPPLPVKKLTPTEFLKHVSSAIGGTAHPDIMKSCPSLFLNDNRFYSSNQFAITDGSYAGNNEINPYLEGNLMSTVDKSIAKILKYTDMTNRMDVLLRRFENLAIILHNDTSPFTLEQLKGASGPEILDICRTTNSFVMAEQSIQKQIVDNLTDAIAQNLVLRGYFVSMDHEEVREVIRERQIELAQALFEYKGVVEDVLQQRIQFDPTTDEPLWAAKNAWEVAERFMLEAEALSEVAKAELQAVEADVNSLPEILESRKQAVQEAEDALRDRKTALSEREETRDKLMWEAQERKFENEDGKLRDRMRESINRRIGRH